MKIEVERINNYVAVTIKYNHIVLDIGLLNKDERKIMAATFIKAAEELLDGADKK